VCPDHVRRHANQLSSQIPKSIRFELSVTFLNPEILSLDPTQIAYSLAKTNIAPGPCGEFARQTPWFKNAHPEKPAPLLRLSYSDCR
jgi:hypothetical protein